jgi:hypothetical protein
MSKPHLETSINLVSLNQVMTPHKYFHMNNMEVTLLTCDPQVVKT